jgi:NAD(P)-dependent dehydrogenase (short-subunit alcohol dehydrogenase family)
MDKTILITGAGSGIGRATAQAFLDHGWKVALLGRREAPLHATAGGHDNARVVPCDVTDADALTEVFAGIAADWGRLDVLFNNAGTNVPGRPIDEIGIDEWKQVSDINITGMFLAARAAFGLMRHQSPMGGRIINNGSISADRPRPGSVPYTMSKHAVTGLTKTLSLDGRPFDIACSQIDIGNALTDMAAAMTKGVPQADGATKVEPVMDVSHVADALLHIAGLPLDVNVQFMTVMATKMPLVGRG